MVDVKLVTRLAEELSVIENENKEALDAALAAASEHRRLTDLHVVTDKRREEKRKELRRAAGMFD